jgi:NhaP-type Na+/H+ or K+/H+ antiporter
VVKSFIGTDSELCLSLTACTVSFLANLLTICIPYLVLQGATLSVPCFGLRDSAGVLAGNLVEEGGGST